MEWLVVSIIVLGVLILSLRAYIRHQEMQYVRAALDEHFKPIEVNLEKHGDIVYAFTADNDRFVGQGKTKEELTQHIASMSFLKGKNVNVKVRDLVKVGFHVDET